MRTYLLEKSRVVFQVRRPFFWGLCSGNSIVWVFSLC